MFVQIERRSFVAAALLLGLGGIAGRARADEALPKAETIIEKYIEATGGKAAYEKLRTEITTATMELVGKGIKGTLTTYKAAPDKSYTVTEIEGIGKIEEGSNGQVAWSRSAIQGPRVKDGPEKALALHAGRFNGELHWRDLYKKVETTGTETVDGKECYKLILTPNDGNPITRFYDKKSSLLVKTAMTVKTQMGDFPVESMVSDYRKEGEILMAHRVMQKAAMGEITVVLESVKYNAEIPKNRFDLPEDIKPLVK